MSPLPCHGVPLGSGCLFPPTGKGSLGLEPELCAAAWGCCWHPLGTEVSLSDSTEAWETPAQAGVFLPWLLAQLTGKAEGNSLELCGQKLWSETLLEMHLCWLSSSVGLGRVLQW